ncbi:glycosyltransferase family 4 protein [Castellaniella denitrificans]|uniref:Glycosyltransferase family 4 protein n=1 Tax=Castellaniella denitrificans TaxID=56119 RepID=A0ABT4LZS1_9BURK|nr:glycosyltransferase family 4 protein [Castellaniella denitrificans]MCZ4328551.1 glycosyltransferase family 4 protein [Castellaniella denitrificans]
MRLLLVGGFAESLLNFRGALIDDLLRAGVEVHVAAPGLSQGECRQALLARGAVPHDIALRRTGMNPVADLVALYGLWRLMHRLRPDVFLGYTIKPVVYGLLAARLAGVGRRYALITGLGYAFQARPEGFKARLVTGLARGLYRLALFAADRVFFQNPDDQALFRSNGLLGARVPSVVVNGSGVDVRHFEKAPMPDGSVRFLMIARLLGAKGVREYAQAASRLHREFPDAAFRLAGWIDDGPDSIGVEELQAWIQEGSVEYLGRLADVRPALQDCCVYVLPSYREGTPRTVLEAMAIGRAVVTTDAPGCRETVVDGVNGYLVPVGSSDGLADAMRRFLEEPALAREMGAHSRRIAEERYDVRRVNAEMLQGMGIVS